MEICTMLRVLVGFICLHRSWLLTVTEKNDISERLAFLEDLPVEMEHIIRTNDVEVLKAHSAIKDTEKTLERDFSRLQNSYKRKIRKGYRNIMKEVKKEIKYDNRFIKEMIESVKHIDINTADYQKGNNITGGLKNVNAHSDKRFDEGTDIEQGTLQFV